MAFGMIGFNPGANPRQRGVMPVFHTYSTADAIATVEAANYFDAVAAFLTTGDVIYAKMTDGSRFYQVAVSGSPGVVTLPSKAQFGTGVGAVVALTENGGAIGGAPNNDLPLLTATATNPAAPTAYSAHASGAVPVTSNAATDLDTTAAALATLRGEVATYETAISALILDVDALRNAVRDIANKVNQIRAAV